MIGTAIAPVRKPGLGRLTDVPEIVSDAPKTQKQAIWMQNL